MRLICPNCSAQYEVDDTAIPEGGRDVQCSSCGHAWFQLPGRQEAGLDVPVSGADATSASGDVPAGDKVPESVTPAEAPEQGSDRPAFESEAQDHVTPAQASATSAPELEDEEDDELDTVESDSADAASPWPGMGEASPEPASSRALDDAVRDVLREEAEREARARQAEAVALETQPDLGLSAAPRPQRPGRTESSALEDDGAGAEPTSRRNQLPDIEEINSSLRPASERDLAMAPAFEEDEEAFAQRRRGFRIGFVVALLLVILLLSLYSYAPLLEQRVPASEPWLTAYVALLDGWRQSIAQGTDTAIRGLTELITSFTG